MTEWSCEQALARSIELWERRGVEFDHLTSCRCLAQSRMWRLRVLFER